MAWWIWSSIATLLFVMSYALSKLGKIVSETLFWAGANCLIVGLLAMIGLTPLSLQVGAWIFLAAFELITALTQKQPKFKPVPIKGEARGKITAEKEGFVVLEKSLEGKDIWRAVSTGEEINAGDEIIVVEVSGDRLVVRKAN